ncbi:hypothetical protein GOBAR_AA17501 [Gossypium barbadense]|uniref:Pentacotripeptide-repeat region of PRORP domain-containing protein n=1 Tax=Gossypium barbadense TaxID=3634 RepID=A0A2P5XIK2_GOSBA|nr:hypothetical protein GOBAR_AA17501 [Gossypium barbadense]
MSILRKLNTKFPNPQFISSFFFTRFSSSAQYVDPGPFDDPFPDEPTSSYYDHQVYKAGRNGDMATVGYLLNKRIKDGCFNTMKTFSFITNTDSSLSILDPLIQTLSRLDKGVTRKQAFDLLIARLCKIERIEDSLRVVQTMMEKRELNAATFHPIVNALSKKKRMEEAWRVVDIMRVAGVKPDVTAYNYLLTAFITNTDSSLSILDPLIQTLSRLDKGVTRKQAFDLLIARLCKIERIEDSLRVVQTMMEKRELNAATFHPIVNALSKKKRMEEAWRVVDIMRVAGVKPDVTAYNYLLTAYCSESKLREASAVVKKIEEEGLGADMRTYDALILGACRVGKVEGGLVLLRSMMDAGKSVMYSTHTHLINGMLSIRYYDGAVRFVKACGGRDAMLDQESFGVLANKLVSLGREVEAMVVLSEMKKRGLSFGKKLNDFYEMHLRNIS